MTPDQYFLRAAYQRPVKVHIWTQDLARKGGIQGFSRHLVDAFKAAIGEENVQVFSKNDKTPEAKTVAGAACKAFGSWPKGVRNSVFALRALCDGATMRPDLVVLTHLYFTPIAFWLWQSRRIPYWCVAHGVESWGLTHRAHRRGLQAASRVFAVSSYTRQRILREQQLRPNRVRIISNTFKPDVFQPRPKPEMLLRRHGISSNKRIILTVARLAEAERYKGYDQILRALPRIQAAVPQAHYVLIGEGGDRARIESLAISLGIKNSVTIAGAVTDADLPSYYNLCDVFAMPSKGEGFGIVYLEALSSGKPVLAGNMDGSSDPLQGGTLGALVNPDDVTAIADALIDILKGTFPLAVLYQPAELRRRTIEAFGPKQFVSKVRWQIEEFQREQFPDGGYPAGNLAGY